MEHRQKNISDKKYELKRATQHILASLDGSSEVNGETNDQLDGINSHIKDLDAKVAKLEDQIANKKTMIVSNQHHIDALNSEISKLESYLSDVLEIIKRCEEKQMALAKSKLGRVIV